MSTGFFMLFAQEQPLLSLRYEDYYTPGYYEVIEMYRKLDRHYSNAVLVERGLTDAGKTLHLFIINKEQEFEPEAIKAQGKAV